MKQLPLCNCFVTSFCFVFAKNLINKEHSFPFLNLEDEEARGCKGVDLGISQLPPWPLVTPSASADILLQRSAGIAGPTKADFG